MNQPNTREIEKRLQPEPVEPPLELADRIKSEIPERPNIVDWPARERGVGAGGGAGRRWAIAATIAVAVIGAGLTFRVSRQTSPPDVELQEPRERVIREAPTVGEADGGQIEVAPPAEPLGAPEARSKNVSQPTPDSRSSSERGSGASATTEARLQAATAPPRGPATCGDAVPRNVGPIEPAPGRRRDESVADLRAERQAPAKLRRELFAFQDSSAMPSSIAPRAPQGPPSEDPRYRVPPSTGGTAEPNDQPYGDMFFRSWGVNPFVDTEDDNLSTFGLDVDTGSYTLARSYIERGHLPPPEAIRVEEFINYFDYGDAAPARGDFAIHAESAPSLFASGPRYHLLRFGLRGREIDAADRTPATLVFVVDVSGSMNRGNRLGLVKRSLSLLLDQLRPDDRVGLVVYGSRGRVLLEPSGDLEAIRSAIGHLQAEGSTNAEEGLLLGYELAERYYREETLHRIVLCSDGVANVGRTGPDSILKRIRAATEQGIELTAVGFGMGNYNDLLMEQLADNGDGSYAYVDTLDEARRVFVENLTGTLQTIAAEAKVQVEFDPSVVARYRLLGYENRDIADERFRDDTVDAGEIGAGHAVTALYEIKLHEEARRNEVLATLRLRYESKAAGEIVEVEEPVRLGDGTREWAKASAGLRLASLVAEFGEILRDSYWAKDGDLEEVFGRAQRLSGEFAGDVDVAEFVSLVGQAARLQNRLEAE